MTHYVSEDKKKIRVAFIAGTYQPSHCGIAHYTERLIEELSQWHTICADVLTTFEAAQKIQHPNVRGVVHGWGFLDLFSLAKTIAKLRFDVVHFQYTGGRSGRYDNKDAILLLPLMLRMMRWSGHIVVTVHEQYERRENEWHLPCIPRSFEERLKLWGQVHGLWDREGGVLLPSSSAILVSNSYHETLIRTRLPSMNNRVYQIPIGSTIDVLPSSSGDAKQALCRKFNWPEDSLILTFFGFLNLQKDLELLIRVFGDVRRVDKRARLLLVGGFENRLFDYESAKRHRERIYELIDQLDLSHFVQTTGYVAEGEVSQYLLGADVGVLPFKNGTTLKSSSLKSMLVHGLPVIATKHNPPDPDLEGKFVVRSLTPGDHIGLTEALLELMSSPELRAKMSAANRDHLNEFSWANIGLRHLELYQRIL